MGTDRATKLCLCSGTGEGEGGELTKPFRVSPVILVYAEVYPEYFFCISCKWGQFGNIIINS